jgi:MFS family permease
MSTTGIRSQAMEEGLSRTFLALVYINAFITGAVVMGFEMLGSRYLNPFFGSGIYTWAALISTVLAALTAGYFFGGWMADRRPTPTGLGWLIVGGSAYLAVIPLFADAMLQILSDLLGGLSEQREFERWGSIIGAMLLLFVPLALLGVYSPYAIRLTLRATTRSGTVAGRIYGISTLGSIFGTLFVTFYLIPTMGSRHITYLLSAIGIASGLSFLFVRPTTLLRAVPAAGALLLAALAHPQIGSAETAPPATAEAREIADRFLAHLKKRGIEVRHGDLETGAAGGFRLKDVVLSGPDRIEWKAAALEARAFAERSSGEAELSGVTIVGLDVVGRDKTAVKAAKAAVDALVWRDATRFSIEGLSVQDIAVMPPSGETVRAGSLALASWHFDEAKSGRLEKLAVRSITVSAKDESGSIGAFDIDRIDVDFPARLSIKGVALRDMAVTTPQQQTIRLGSIELRALEAANLLDGNPANLLAFEFAIRDFAAPLLGRDPVFERDLRDLGYNAIKLNSEIVYRYEPEGKNYNLAKFEIDFAEMGTLALAVKIGGLSPEEIRTALQPPKPSPTAPPQRDLSPGSRYGLAAMGVFARLNLVSADFSYRDKSLLGRLFKREAERNQSDEASVRTRWRALLLGYRQEQTDPLAKDAIDALLAFLDDPGELIIEIRPPGPINLVALGTLAAANPSSLRGLLGLKITAKKP